MGWLKRLLGLEFHDRSPLVVEDSTRSDVKPCPAPSATNASDDQGCAVSELLYRIREHVSILAGDTSQDERITKLVCLGPSVMIAIDSSIRWCIDAGRWENAGLLCEAAARIGGAEARELLRYYATAVSNIYEYERYVRPAAERGLAQLAEDQPQAPDASPPTPATPGAMTDHQMVQKLTELARYYAGGGLSKDNPTLVDEAMQIGRYLNDRGGKNEMLRIFHMIPAMQGKRTVEMTWDGIGDWRG